MPQFRVTGTKKSARLGLIHHVSKRVGFLTLAPAHDARTAIEVGSRTGGTGLLI